MARAWPIGFVLLVALARPTFAGPPYVSDDPVPTDYKHFEIYTFNSGTTTQGGSSGATGIDFNYGAAPDLQLTATLPAGFDRPAGGKPSISLSNVELAAKYRFLASRHLWPGCKHFPSRVSAERFQRGGQ